NWRGKGSRKVDKWGFWAKRSLLHFAMCAGELASGGDARRRLRGQGEAGLGYEQLFIGIELGVAGQNQDTAVGGREVDVEHLHACQLVEDRPGREAAGQRLSRARSVTWRQ